MPTFTPEEIEVLKKYITDPTGDVFCIKNMPGLVGAAYARYSRARGGFREVLLKEFISEGVVDAEHAEDLIERVLIAYGDDSVGELEGAHISFENISILATKEIEECRIGGSPIEQSTRYVFYDQKDAQGKYKYIVPPELEGSDLANEYTEAMDFLFDTYCRLIEPMKEFYKKRLPLKQAEYDVLGNGNKQHYEELENEKDQKAFKTTYNMDIRTKACDTLRYILPLATTTNVGIFGNGRFHQSMISALLSSHFRETQRLGDAALRELSKIIPVYVRRAKRDEYRTTIEHDMERLVSDLLANVEAETPTEEIHLMDEGEAYIAKHLNGQSDPAALRQAIARYRDTSLLAHILYAYAQHPLSQLMDFVEQLSEEKRKEIIDTYIGQRRTRRDRPYRAFESGYPYTFDLVTDFGSYKDLMRHRMTTQLRQRFSPELGFAMPQDIIEAGFSEEIQACHERSQELYRKLAKQLPQIAQYAALHGSKVRWVIGMNEREAYHLLELRTTPQGHPAYRKVGQEMHKRIQERSAWRAARMSFVDHNSYTSARGDSEAKQRVKERKYEETHGA
ncbi:MAG: FAD-dependent thymidylate synthase [Candidatus Nomurabacteria bacterium]|nr:MAG: FAD-dependent thymidylate synthase [Candidatus Nomurabacteria bacterium]